MDFKGQRYFHSLITTVMLHLLPTHTHTHTHTHIHKVKMWSCILIKHPPPVLITWGTTLIIPLWCEQQAHFTYSWKDLSLVGLDDQKWLFEVENFKKNDIICVSSPPQKSWTFHRSTFFMHYLISFSFSLKWVSQQLLIFGSRALTDCVYSYSLLKPGRDVDDSPGMGTGPSTLWVTLRRLWQTAVEK